MLRIITTTNRVGGGERISPPAGCMASQKFCLFDHEIAIKASSALFVNFRHKFLMNCLEVDKIMAKDRSTQARTKLYKT